MTYDQSLTELGLIRVLSIGQKALNCLAVMHSFCLGTRRIFRERDSKNTPVIACYIVCLFVISSVSPEAGATPNRDEIAELVNGRQVPLVAGESNCCEGAVGVFSEVEKGIFEGATVIGGSVAMPLDVWSGYGIKEPHEQHASGTKERNVKGGERDTIIIHWGGLLVVALWMGVAFSFGRVFGLIEMSRHIAKTPNV